MQIGIRGIFGFSEIFGGKLGFTTKCQLELVGKYSLIYAEVDNLDILQALDQAFDLGLGDCSLNVASAGFFTFSAHSGAPAVALGKVFQDSPVPAKIAADALPVVDTTSFWLTVDLSGKNTDRGLFGSIVDIGVAPGTQLSLSATFAKGVQAANAIKSADYTLSLDGEIQLFTLFTFKNLSVKYSIGAATRVVIEGDIGIDLFNSHFDFSGSVISDSRAQAVTADVRARGSADLPSLFGGKFPRIAFKGVRFNLYYPYGNGAQAAQFMVRGSCSFGDHKFTGLLYLEGMKPVLASVVFTQPASISTLFKQCLPQASWPSDLIDLTLKAGSQAYYNGSARQLALTLSSDASGPTLLPVPGGQQGQGEVALPTSSQPVTYRTGFNVSASFTLSLLDSIHVSGDLVVNADGVAASIGIANPINLYVVRITRHDRPSLGPVFSIETKGNGGTMRLDADLLFFGEDFGANAAVVLARSKDGSLSASTTLSPTKDYPPLLTTASRLGFSYSDKEGFRLTDWPDIQAAQDIVDFFGELKKAADSGSGACGRIADFVCQNLLKQTYSIKPTFTSGSHGLSLSLSVVCTLSFSGGASRNTAFATISLRPLVIAIPTNINLDRTSPHYLWTVIADEIASMASQLIDALLSDSDAIATFLVLFAGKQAVGYAATLICQGATNAAVAGAVVAGVAAAGAALGTEAVSLALVAAAVLGAIAAAGGGSGGGGGQTSPPKAPTKVTATILGKRIAVKWSPSSGGHNYIVTLGRPQDSLGSSGILPYDTTHYDFDNIERPSDLPVDVTVAVVASNPAGQSDPGTTTIRFLAAPTGLTSLPDSEPACDSAVRVRWAAVDGATGYVIAQTGGRSDMLNSEKAEATVRFAPTDPAGPYQMRVMATGGVASLPSAWSEPLDLVRLDVPMGLNVHATAVSIEAGWHAVPNAAAYMLGWNSPGDTAGKLLVGAGSDPTVLGRILLPEPIVEGVWTITLQALPADGPGRFVASPCTAPQGVAVTGPGSPVIMAASYFSLGVDGKACGQKLIGAFPTLTGDTLASAMAQGGYAARATADGLHDAFPTITPTQMAVALAQAYPEPPRTPAELCKRCYMHHVSGADCGEQSMSAFPNLMPDPLAFAMAKAGYAAEDTASGLMAAFPRILPQQMARSLARAYT